MEIPGGALVPDIYCAAVGQVALWLINGLPVKSDPLHLDDKTRSAGEASAKWGCSPSPINNVSVGLCARPIVVL